MNEIERLTNNWIATKANLAAAQEAHLQSEIGLYNAVKDQLPKKGTFTTDTGMKITCGFKESWDQGTLQAAYQSWNAPVPFPFKGEWKPDGKALTYIKENLPDAWRVLQEALTTAERKPAFSMPDK